MGFLSEVVNPAEAPSQNFWSARLLISLALLCSMYRELLKPGVLSKFLRSTAGEGWITFQDVYMDS